MTTQDVDVESEQSNPRLGKFVISLFLKLVKSDSAILISLSDGSMITYLLAKLTDVPLIKISLRVITQLVALIVLRTVGPLQVDGIFGLQS